MPGTAGVNYDQLAQQGGSLTYGGALELNFSNTNPFADNSTFNLFAGFGSTSGSLASVSTIGSGLYANLSFTSAGDGKWYSGSTSNGQYLLFDPANGNLVVVPEPSTWLLAAAGLGITVPFLRRRRRAEA